MHLLLLVGLAHAHLPHPAMIGVAIPPDFEESERAWALMVVDGSAMGLGWALINTEDSGRHWNPATRPPYGGDTPAIAANAEGPWLLGGDHLYHLRGETWEEVPLPEAGATLLAASDDGTLIGGPGGGWWLPAGTTEWQELTDVRVTGLALGAEVSLLLDGGTLLRGTPGALHSLTPPGMATLVADDGAGRLYLAGRDGFWSVDSADTWTTCGVLTPTDPRAEYATSIVRLAASPTALLVGTGQSLYRSTDHCGTYTEEVPFVEVMDYSGGAGSASGPDAAYTALAINGSVSLVLSYRGVAVAGTGQGWWEARVIDGTFARGLAVTDGGANVWATSYGGGLLYSTDRGATWDIHAVFETMEGSFGRDVTPLPDGDAAYLGDLWSYRVGSGGVAELDVGISSPRALWGTDTAAFCLGIPSETADLSYTADGANWTPAELGDGEAIEVQGGIWAGAPVTLVRLQQPSRVLASTNGGASWTPWIDDGRDTSGVALWSSVDGDRAVRSLTEGGVELTEGGETRAATAAPARPLARIVVDPAGGLAAFDTTGVLWHSEDGGDTWTESAGRVDAPQDLIAASSLLFATGLRGALWSDDRGDTWTSLPWVETLDIRNTMMGCLGPDGNPCDRAAPLLEFSRLTVSTRASSVTVEATGASALEVTIDHDAPVPVDLGVEIPLGDGEWHDIMLMVMGEPLTVDAVTFRYDGTAAPAAGPDDTGDTGDTGESGDTGDTGDTGSFDTGGKDDTTGCGCGGSSPVTLAPLLGALAMIRRRRPG